jgi:nuclear pore complex protein Nup62
VALAPAAVATSQKEPPSIEYQTLTVEHILNKFQKQLEEDSLVFVEEAKRVCEYDAILRDSRRDLGNLTHEAQRLVAEQDRTEDQLQGIGVIQNQIEKTLTQVEDQIDLIFQKQSHLTAQDADREREAAYDTAKIVDDCLDNIMASLSTTFDQLSMANSQAFDTQTAEIMKILNKHEDSLNDLEAFAQKLDVDCNEVTQMLQGLRH